MKMRPIIVEIVGPSGAGKSTLSARLNKSGADIKAGMTVWGLPLTSLVVSGFISLPILIRLIVERRRVKKDELKQVIRLTAFFSLLRDYINGKHGLRYSALLLDEGVIFALAKLRADVGSEFANPAMRRWERQMLDRWAEILDAVVWLDAPDEVLLKRIRERAKHHRMKNRPEAEVFEFLRRYRAAYEFVISEIQKRGTTHVMWFRSEDLDPDTIMQEILSLARTAWNPLDRKNVFAAANGVKNEQAT